MARRFTDDELKKRLTPEQYDILRQKGTEAPFTGELLHSKKTGMYVCPVCGNELFSSDTKFDSGSGWPSFYDVARSDAVRLVEDHGHGMQRVEVRCAVCDSHLGHVFHDAPDQPTGMRFCINSAALKFMPKSGTEEKTEVSAPESPSAESEFPPFRERVDLPDGLALRLPVQADAPRILELTEQNREKLKVWFPWAEDVIDAESAHKYIEDRQEGAKDRSLLAYLIESNGLVAGAISAKLNWQLQTANIGYWLAEEFHGQGIAKKSLRAASQYCFEELNLHRLELDIAVDNLPSIAVAEKAGFVREGVRREAWPDQDTYHDMAIYGLLRRDVTR